jgi:hypothetical protein
MNHSRILYVLEVVFVIGGSTSVVEAAAIRYTEELAAIYNCEIERTGFKTIRSQSWNPRIK